jgi:membrane protease YdiL (CAAX protease family)
MNPNILSRFRSLQFCDRLLILLAIACAVAGVPGNYFRVRGLANDALLFWTLVAMMLWVGIAGVIAWSVIRRQRRPADYGLSFRPGGVASLVMLALIHIYLAITGKFVLNANGSLVFSVWGVFTEELLFRSVAIDKFILLMNGIRHKAFWAILASSVLWSVPHITSKSPSQLLGGIFLGALFFGYIYYKSRSILLPAWIHGVANAGYPGGLLIAALYCALGAADCAIASRNKKHSRAATGSRSAGAMGA